MNDLIHELKQDHRVIQQVVAGMSAVAELLDSGKQVDPSVQELLRHASLKVTTDVYMQAVSPQKREAQSKLMKMVLKKAASK